MAFRMWEIELKCRANQLRRRLDKIFLQFHNVGEKPTSHFSFTLEYCFKYGAFWRSSRNDPSTDLSS